MSRLSGIRLDQEKQDECVMKPARGERSKMWVSKL